MLFKCLRPDKVTFILYDYIKTYLGSKFVNPLPIDLNSIYLESNNRTPILFILTPGVDPYMNLKKLEKIYNI